MDEIKYLNFDLLIERTEEGYTARVMNSPAGQASADFSLPFSELELENFLLRVGRTRRGVRCLESPEMEAVKTFGGRLFQAVFGDEVRGCLRSSLDEASRQEAGLRIRLRLAEAPELADLPWEYLYNPSLNRFLVLSTETPLVRYLDLPERIRPLAVKPPLKVLVMISSPRDYPPLDVEGEWKKLSEALDDLEQQRLVTLERLEEATLTALQRRFRRGGYHIFHFIGHGSFDEQAQDGVLLLEDERGRGRSVSGQYLGTLMHDERTLRLAILNACEGARTSRSDPFAGTAQSLVQQGIPAVIAMQFEITDEAAITLANEFYTALADGYPVDGALAEARKAILIQENDVEWGTPVLYLRAPDGRIFDIERVSEEERKSAQVSALYREAQTQQQPEKDRARRSWPPQPEARPERPSPADTASPALPQLLPGIWQVQVSYPHTSVFSHQVILEIQSNGLFRGQVQGQAGISYIQGQWQITLSNQIILRGQQTTGIQVASFSTMVQFTQIAPDLLMGVSSAGEQTVWQRKDQSGENWGGIGTG